MKMQPRLRSKSGQMTIEAILILMLMVSIFTLTQRKIKESGYFRQIVSGPWAHIAGMIENGVWKPVDEGKKTHPNVFGRRASPEPI